MSRTPTDAIGKAPATIAGRYPACNVGGSHPDRLDAESIVCSTTRAALATDRDSRITCWNGAATELLGHRAQDVVGRTVQGVLDARDVFGNPLCRRHCVFHELARTGQAPEGFELDVRSGSDERIRVAVSIVVVLEPERTDYALVYLMTPIRRRRRADEAIDRLLAQSGGEAPGGGGYRYRRRWSDRGVLTERQLEVLRCLAGGGSVRTVAAALGISVHTVRSHVRRIFETLEVSSQVEAVAKALRERLI